MELGHSMPYDISIFRFQTLWGEYSSFEAILHQKQVHANQ